MAKVAEYYLLQDGQVLARVEDNVLMKASVFGDGKWTRVDHVALKVTGIGGDADFEQVSEKQAKTLYPEAFV